MIPVPRLNLWFCATLSWFLLTAWVSRRAAAPVLPAREGAVLEEAAEEDIVEAALARMDANDPAGAARARAALQEFERFQREAGIDLRPAMDIQTGPIMAALSRRNFLTPTTSRMVWEKLIIMAWDNGRSFRGLWVAAVGILGGIAVLLFLMGSGRTAALWVDTLYLGLTSLLWIEGFLFLAAYFWGRVPLFGAVPADMWKVPLAAWLAAGLLTGRVAWTRRKKSAAPASSDRLYASSSQTMYGGELHHPKARPLVDRLLERWLGD